MADRQDDGGATFLRMTDRDVIGALRHILHVLAGIREAHALGHSPSGQHTGDPFTDVLPLLIRSVVAGVPDRAARGRAEWICDIARFMTARGSPPEVEGDWILVTETYARLADAYMEAIDDDVGAEPAAEAREIVPLYTLDYPTMGRVLDATLVARFQAAVEAVLAALDHHQQTNPLSADEIDLVRRLVDGRPISDLAAELGRSDRSIYRALRNIWIRVGASSRSEGVAIITARGWLDPAPAERQRRGRP